MVPGCRLLFVIWCALFDVCGLLLVGCCLCLLLYGFHGSLCVLRCFILVFVSCLLRFVDCLCCLIFVVCYCSSLLVFVDCWLLFVADRCSLLVVCRLLFSLCGVSC